MKKILLLFVLSSSYAYSFDRFICCFCYKKQQSKAQARRDWVDKNFALDLKDLGIECTMQDIQQLSPDQRSYLQGLKNSYVAQESFPSYVESSAKRANDYPEPFKAGLIEFNRKFVELKKELSQVYASQESSLDE